MDPIHMCHPYTKEMKSVSIEPYPTSSTINYEIKAPSFSNYGTYTYDKFFSDKGSEI